MSFTAAMQKALCSLDNKLSGLIAKWEKELKGVNASVKSVSRTGEVPQQIVRRNPKRVEVWIHNAGDKDLFLAPYNGEVDQDLYSLKIQPNDTLIMNSHNYAHLYKGSIYGFWDLNADEKSNAKVTEFYIDN